MAGALNLLLWFSDVDKLKALVVVPLLDGEAIEEYLTDDLLAEDAVGVYTDLAFVKVDESDEAVLPFALLSVAFELEGLEIMYPLGDVELEGFNPELA